MADSVDAQTREDEALGRCVRELLDVMAALRTPVTGCPWDLEQTFATIAPYTIEESYEVADAIDRNDLAGLRQELGDLLFQVVYHARMAEELRAFDFRAVVEALTQKMIARHPHVFGERAVASASEQTEAWEAGKALERRARGDCLLDDVPLAMPALLRAEKLTKRAARVGFDWESPDQVLEKMDEEMRELAEARAAGDLAHSQEELGDVLFVAANLARKLGINPETALREANSKFEARFRRMEAMLGDARHETRDLAEWDALWLAAKRQERA
jgi:MazG family protein